MRFEVISAFVLGALLPILETMRRGIGHWMVNFTTMFEDYFAGSLLLIAGLLSIRRQRYAPMFLLTAWAYNTGMMGSSFWGQLESTIRATETEPNNATVLFFKLMLWGTCVISLVLSFRRATEANRTPPASSG